MLQVSFFFLVNYHSCFYHQPSASNRSLTKSQLSTTTGAVALRCASMAVAQMPIVFSLTGRNSVVELLTGISYQQLRFSHKLFGYLFVFLILIHFLGILLAVSNFF